MNDLLNVSISYSFFQCGQNIFNNNFTLKELKESYFIGRNFINFEELEKSIKNNSTYEFKNESLDFIGLIKKL